MSAEKQAEKSGWSWIHNRWLAIVFRLILAAIFLTSSLGKLPDIEAYSVDIVYDFGILPMWMARPFGLVMPYIELLCALGLLGGVLTRLSAIGVSLMSLSFFIAKGILLLQGRNINCGCFGAIMDTLASQSIFMDIPQLLMGLVVASSRNRNWIALHRFLPDAWKEKLKAVW
jgi:hypothetical protein